MHIKSDNCTGCGVCKYICPNNAIELIRDNKGFYIASIEKKNCVECGKCVQFCHKERNVQIYTKPYKQYAVKHVDSEIRSNSRSGGIFTALSDAIIEKGGVVFGAVLDDSFQVHHEKAMDCEGRNRMRGSKYVQSKITHVISEIDKELKRGRLVLFSGTPCQTAALRCLFDDNKYQNLFLCDCICHGVPSASFFEDYLSWCKKHYHGNVTGFDFRDKNKFGWEAHVERIEISEKKYWSKRFANLFASSKSLRETCFSCKYATVDRCSDFTIGDYWGIDDINTDFYDNEGISALIIRSDKGLDLFNSIKDKVIFLSTDEYELSHYNLKIPTSKPDDYEEFWNDYFEKGFDYVSRKYGGYDLLHRLKNKLVMKID